MLWFALTITAIVIVAMGIRIAWLETANDALNKVVTEQAVTIRKMLTRRAA